MVKTKVRAKTPATKSRSKSKQPSEPEPLFLKGAIVAIPGHEAGNDFKLAKLLENVYEDSENVRIAYLKAYEQEPLSHIYYQDTIQGEIAGDEVITQADVTETKGRIKTKGYRKTLYKLSRHAFTKVKALAKNFIGIGKDEEESDVEEEEEESEEEEEEEEEKPARAIKKVTGKKGAAKKKEEEEEEMEEEEKPAPRRSTRSSGKKTEEVTRSTKKAKVTGKKGKATKEEDLDEEEEEEEEAEEEPKGAKGAKAPAKGAAAKGKKGKKSEKEKKPIDHSKYTKGQWNPNVNVVERNEMLEGTSNNVIDYESTRANNKNIIRAVYTKNHKLLEECLSKDNFFSNLFQRWGVETDFNAIELAVKNKDKKAIQLICKAIKDKKPKLISEPRSALSSFDTGHQSKYAYGTFTRRVQMGRGNKELNAALNKDEGHSYPFDPITVQRILESDIEPELLDMLRVEVEGMDGNICGNLQAALHSGNVKIAAYIAQKLYKATGHGVNALHVEVLTKDNPEELSDFRKPSATAKTIGNAITPIHFACINPNAKILEALLNKVPEYSLADFMMHRPMHYAAACTGPEPLKLLISKSIDFREGTRARLTPLMIAAMYGREENVKVLLGEGDPSIVPYKTREGMTSIHYAAERGHLGCLKLLLEAGGDIDAPGKNRMTPLIMAAANGHYDCVEYLLTSGAKILAKDKFKKSALILAIQNGHVKIVSYLLKHGAEFNQADSSNNYPMHYAAAYGYEECLDLLKQAGADQNVSNALKVTPLTVALLKNNTGIMKKLLSYENTDVNCKDESGRTLIMCAIEALTKANYEQIKFLIKEKNADPNILDMQGSTALHYVASLDVANLAQMNANMNRYDTHEQRQEDVDRFTKEFQTLQIEIAELLLENGADINKPNFEGVSPFFTAIQSNNFKVCELFLANKSLDITSINKKDEGIYHFLANSAGEKRSFEIFSAIADRVGNENGLINHVDIQGFTPILKFVKVFAQHSNNLLQTIFEEHQENLLSKKQREWDEKHKEILAKQPAKPAANLDVEDEEDEDEEEAEVKLRGGARTFQTARKSTGGKAPRKQLGGLFGGYRGRSLFGTNTYGGGVFGDQDKDERPVALSIEEHNQIQEIAEQEFGAHVEKFIAILKRLIDLGANLGDSVQRLRPFRKVLKTKDPKEQDLKLKMIAEIIKKRRAQQAQQNMFGNRYGGGYYGGGGLFGNRHRQQQQSKRPVEYCPQGNQNALHLAQAYPHPKLIDFLLGSGAININQQDYMKRTPLYCFVKIQGETLGFKTQSSEILELLLTHKADPNLGNIQNELPAFLTVKLQKLHFLEALTRHGVNLNVTNKSGETPLILSVKNKYFSYAEVLLKAGADPNIKGKHHRTALHYALNNSSAGADASFEMESLLLKHGAKINDVDDRGRTPLHYAFIKIGNPFDKTRIDPVEIVTSYCAQKDVDVTIKDIWGSSPLHYAAQRGAQVCALTLLTLGAKVNEKDSDGNTPLAVAIISGHPNVSIMLMQSAATVDGEVSVVKKDLAEIRRKAKELKKAEQEKAKAETVMEEEKPAEEETNASETIEEEALVEIEELEQVQADEVEDEEFEEEEEEEDNNQNYNQYGGGGLFGKPYGHHYGGGGLFGHHHQHHQNVDLPEGKYSMFSAAIKKNYQGVAYLMLQSGYDLMSAIQDAMNDEKFNYVWTLLTKVEDQSVLHKTNLQGQNLFHTFALKGRTAGNDLTEKIFNAFVNRGISSSLTDSEGRTPLHYAAQENFPQLFTLFLENGADINVQDKKGYTPFTLQLVKEGINEVNIQTYIKYHAAFDLRFKVTVKGDEIEMGPLTYLISKGSKNFEIFRQLLNNKVSINENDEDGRTGLMYSIKENSDKLVAFFLNYPDLDRGQKDNDGRTPIHYAVSPLEYGSYENEKILEMIAPYFDVNEPDNQGKTPMYYAYLQDSGVMVQKLKELGAKDNKPPANIKRAATSVIASVEWSKEEIDYEEDAEKFIEEAAKLEKNILEVEEKVKPDQSCDSPQQHEVVYDEKLGPYDLYMTKVDIQRGYYGGNVFYKMQVLHNKVRDYYTVLTRYGRIGEFGQTQNTPHPSKEDAIEQFCKIFRSKAGNEWNQKDRFEKVKGKYRLLEFTKRVSHKEYLTPFDLKNPKVPKCELEDEIKTIVNDITDVKMYQQMMNTYSIDTDILPLASLNRTLLNEAQAILFEIKELIEDMTGERRQDMAARSNQKILDIREKISEKSSRFYELIPDSRYRNTPIPPLDNQHSLGEKSKMLDNLLDFEISSRIMLGALNKMFVMNPLDYCFQALTIKMITLDKEHAEYQLIKQYVNASHKGADKDFIQNIYALERKGEVERYSQFSHLKNKMLLWHGSKIANFMGILGQGLRIAPPEAYSTGDMFGKGVYFADTFTKSYGYTQDWNVRKGYRLLLLCEVALGEMLELREAQNITDLQSPYKSVKGLGRQGPSKDHKLVMPNGCVAPIGEITDYYQGITDYNVLPRLSWNEYIVYDVNQVRIRYLVQVKDQ